MKTVVQGKKITNKWSVDTGKEKRIINGEEREIFVKKPSLTKEEEIEWADICEYDERPQYSYNNPLSLVRSIDLSENESVCVEEEIFRADLVEYLQRVNKVIEEIDENKEESETELQMLVAEFNKTAIENNMEMLNYCKLHKLTPGETDAEELYKLLHPDESFRFNIIQQTYREDISIDDEIRYIRKSVHDILSGVEVDKATGAILRVKPQELLDSAEEDED